MIAATLASALARVCRATSRAITPSAASSPRNSLAALVKAAASRVVVVGSV
jgi:hypothetical protein